MTPTHPQMSEEIVKIVKDEDNQFGWQRLARNNRVTHKSKRPYKQKHTAIVAAVRENMDIYRENLRDTTSGTLRVCTSRVANRLKSKNLGKAGNVK